MPSHPIRCSFMQKIILPRPLALWHPRPMPEPSILSRSSRPLARLALAFLFWPPIAGTPDAGLTNNSRTASESSLISATYRLAIFFFFMTKDQIITTAMKAARRKVEGDLLFSGCKPLAKLTEDEKRIVCNALLAYAETGALVGVETALAMQAGKEPVGHLFK